MSYRFVNEANVILLAYNIISGIVDIWSAIIFFDKN